ncbi:GYD domain-containing protein [Variovorax soli]|uniref:Uncharacterized protein with GYD domain n=1 Tax=Variovorax soli TaxID=376815 RepID=A0ABU1NBP8_9BURK|nr:GYD domain-containing protein [Variovorax soli]MDR6535768.1 uncharacterized protein with GYD domain [Variovorax soli]
MSFYLVQASYDTSATASLIKNPQDRAAAVAPVFESTGGKLHGLWLSFGDYDVVAIAELPDNASAAAISMAIGASGALRTFKTTPLLTPSEAMEAMKKAAKVKYQPPK